MNNSKHSSSSSSSSSYAPLPLKRDVRDEKKGSGPSVDGRGGGRGLQYSSSEDEEVYRDKNHFTTSASSPSHPSVSFNSKGNVGSLPQKEQGAKTSKQKKGKEKEKGKKKETDVQTTFSGHFGGNGTGAGGTLSDINLGSTLSGKFGESNSEITNKRDREDEEVENSRDKKILKPDPTSSESSQILDSPPSPAPPPSLEHTFPLCSDITEMDAAYFCTAAMAVVTEVIKEDIKAVVKKVKPTLWDLRRIVKPSDEFKVLPRVLDNDFLFLVKFINAYQKEFYDIWGKPYYEIFNLLEVIRDCRNDVSHLPRWKTEYSSYMNFIARALFDLQGIHKFYVVSKLDERAANTYVYLVNKTLCNLDIRNLMDESIADLDKRITHLENKIQDQKEEITKMSAQNEKMNEKMISMSTQISDQNEKISMLSTQNEKMSAQISEQNEKMNEKITSMSAQISDQNEKITSMSVQISGQNEKITSISTQMSDQNEKISSLSAQNEKISSQNEKMNEQITSMSAQMSDQNVQMKETMCMILEGVKSLSKQKG